MNRYDIEIVCGGIPGADNCGNKFVIKNAMGRIRDLGHILDLALHDAGWVECLVDGERWMWQCPKCDKMEET